MSEEANTKPEALCGARGGREPAARSETKKNITALSIRTHRRKNMICTFVNANEVRFETWGLI